jgi:hypothetical protein
MAKVGRVWTPENSQPAQSLYLQNETDDKDEWLTHEQAVKIGLTPGSRLYRLATGEAQPEA